MLLKDDKAKLLAELAAKENALVTAEAQIAADAVRLQAARAEVQQLQAAPVCTAARTPACAPDLLPCCCGRRAFGNLANDAGRAAI